MNIVTVRVLLADDANAVVKRLRAPLSLPLMALKRAVQSGEPLVRCELYLNDFADVADTLRAVVQVLDDLGEHYEIAEDGEPMSTEVMHNLLSGSEAFR